VRGYTSDQGGAGDGLRLRGWRPAGGDERFLEVFKGQCVISL
jgi:hypothetical protein